MSKALCRVFCTTLVLVAMMLIHYVPIIPREVSDFVILGMAWLILFAGFSLKR